MVEGVRFVYLWVFLSLYGKYRRRNKHLSGNWEVSFTWNIPCLSTGSVNEARLRFRLLVNSKVNYRQLYL